MRPRWEPPEDSGAAKVEIGSIWPAALAVAAILEN